MLIYREALAAAVVDAAEKAAWVAKSAGAHLAGPALVEESNSSTDAAEAAAVNRPAEEAAQLPVEAGRLEVTALNIGWSEGTLRAYNRLCPGQRTGVGF